MIVFHVLLDFTGFYFQLVVVTPVASSLCDGFVTLFGSFFPLFISLNFIFGISRGYKGLLSSCPYRDVSMEFYWVLLGFYLQEAVVTPAVSTFRDGFVTISFYLVNCFYFFKFKMLYSHFPPQRLVLSVTGRFPNVLPSFYWVLPIFFQYYLFYWVTLLLLAYNGLYSI